MIDIDHRYQLLDVLWDIQNANGHIDEDDITAISNQLNIAKVEVESVVSFYHFFHRKKGGKHQVYLNNSIVAEFAGYNKIKEAFEQITGTRTGERNSSKYFSIQDTACIGLSDVEPACLIDFYPFTNLSVSKVNRIISLLKTGVSPESICDHPISDVYIHTKSGKGILFEEYIAGEGISKLKKYSSDEILELLKKAGLSGMGGAFFPTHLKWASCKNEVSAEKYIICNADEGEPGTFKDRSLIQRRPGLILEGMIIAGFTVGAQDGVIYLRAEYKYLEKRLEETIDEFRNQGWLGKDILGISGFDFDVRIQIGAGAYVCGEETALLQSMEGHRGEPRPKIFFPTQKGFLYKPTVVNNVETYCIAAKILSLGIKTYRKYGNKKTYGTKLLSVAGDCDFPGIYEIEWGMSVKSLLNLVGAKDPFIVQLSGPSGDLCFKGEWDKTFDINDLRCGGAVTIFDHSRNIFDILQNYNDFFVQESCGICTPCRAGIFILKKELEQLKLGLSDFQSYKNIYLWSKIMSNASRCGLGKSAPKSLIQAMDKKPEYFSELIATDHLVSLRFDLEKSVRAYELITKNEE